MVILTTPDDLYMQILDVAGTTSWATWRNEACALPFGSATGMACLATLPDAEIVRLAMRARPSGRYAAAGPSLGGIFWSIALSLPGEAFPAPVEHWLSAAEPTAH